MSSTSRTSSASDSGLRPSDSGSLNCGFWVGGGHLPGQLHAELSGAERLPFLSHPAHFLGRPNRYFQARRDGGVHLSFQPRLRREPQTGNYFLPSVGALSRDLSNGWITVVRRAKRLMKYFAPLISGSPLTGFAPRRVLVPFGHNASSGMTICLCSIGRMR